MTPEPEDRASQILQQRCGKWTLVELTENRRLHVFDVAWGRDQDDVCDHITTNISPGPKEQHSVDFFFTCDVLRIVDPASGSVLFTGKRTG